LKLGIIGLPNSGKTTIFNALTGQNIEATADRVASLSISSSPTLTITSAGFIERNCSDPIAACSSMCADITGFSRGISAEKGKTALANLVWDADAVIHVVRAFADESVMHPDGPVDPAADVAALELELVFNDLELAETRLERIASSMKKGVGKELELEQAVLQKCCGELEQERPLCNLDLAGDEHAAIGSLQFLSMKPALVIVNVGEDEIDSEATRSAVAGSRWSWRGWSLKRPPSFSRTLASPSRRATMYYIKPTSCSD
jgi:ribosome-binding ATPase YchF (GTP1/OBG family)